MAGSCLTPSSTIQTYPTAPASDNAVCVFVPEWAACNGCDDEGYAVDAGVAVCINGINYIARSLVDNNKSEPLAGSASVPPTWELKTLPGWLFS